MARKDKTKTIAVIAGNIANEFCRDLMESIRSAIPKGKDIHLIILPGEVLVNEDSNVGVWQYDAMFNGVCFDWLSEDWLVRAAVTVYLLDEDEAQEEGDESHLPCELSVAFFRIAEDMDHWQVLDEDGEWSDDGPPDDLFDHLDELDELDEDDDFDDEEDHWRSDRTLTMLDISVDTYNALDEAGILTMDELSEMTERAVEAIAGPKGLEEVEIALAEEGLRLRKS